jgi:glycosyltransferase involved in cell wall biosynthesis
VLDSSAELAQGIGERSSLALWISVLVLAPGGANSKAHGVDFGAEMGGAPRMEFNPLLPPGHSSATLAARHDTIVITDADMTYPVDQIPALLAEYRKGFDMVVGQRSGAHYSGSAIKAPLRWILKFLVEYAAGRRIPDINSGFRIFNRNTAAAFFAHVRDTFSFTTSLTLAYMMNSKFVGYIPISYHERAGRSKVRLLRDSLRTLQYIVEAVIYFNPLKAFLLLASLTVAGSLFSFLLGAILSIKAPYYLGVGGSMLALLSLCLGFIAVLLKQIMLQSGNRTQS